MSTEFAHTQIFNKTHMKYENICKINDKTRNMRKKYRNVSIDQNSPALTCKDQKRSNITKYRLTEDLQSVN